jgi:iron complex transport system substrate-binding protein
MACHQDSTKTQKNKAVSAAQTIPLKHARGFVIQKQEFNPKEGPSLTLQVQNPWQGASEIFTYHLALGENQKSAAENLNSGLIQIPVERMVSLTTTNLYHLEALGVLNTLVGLGGGRYVCNPRVKQGLQQGSILEVGADGQVDVETVVGLKPDIVFTYGVGNSSDGGLAKLKEAKLTSIIDGAYMEETPLGRAEWIKFTAAFFGKDKLADSIFSEIESNYVALLALTQKAKHRPTVFVNASFSGVWWVPGGRSYVARFLADAGADYLWALDTTRGSLNLDLESVLDKAGKADFWLNPGDWKSLKDGQKQDPRNAFFEAFKQERVFNADKILSETGGNDIFETGPARPDWILADLIFIFHPELLPNHNLHWYRKLEKE